VDTSCLVAIAFAEPGYKAVASRLDRFDQLFASNLLEAELRAAFRREKVTVDHALLRSLSWICPDRPLTAEIETVLDAGQVRGADAWHLACALYLSPDPAELAFLSMDRQQARVAEALGFADRS
jgi:uncharacterized protein with PIN domain